MSGSACARRERPAAARRPARARAKFGVRGGPAGLVRPQRALGPTVLSADLRPCVVSGPAVRALFCFPSHPWVTGRVWEGGVGESGSEDASGILKWEKRLAPRPGAARLRFGVRLGTLR